MIKQIFVSTLIGVALAVAAHAQTTTDASIIGHVKDPQGASLPGATVRLYARDRSFSLITATDSSGAYDFKHLAAGEYLLEAEATGFALATAQSVMVTRG